MLVAKAFDEMGWKGGFTEVVFAVLVFEDLIAIVLLAVVTGGRDGSGLDAAALAILLAKLGGFLALVLVGRSGVRAACDPMDLVARPPRDAADQRAAVVLRDVGARRRRRLLGRARRVPRRRADRGVRARARRVRAGRVISRRLRDDLLRVRRPVDRSARCSPTQALPILVFSVVVLVFKPLGVAGGVFLGGKGVGTGRARGALAGADRRVLVRDRGRRRPTQSLLAIAVGVSCVTTLTSPLLIRAPRQPRRGRRTGCRAGSRRS